MSLAGSSPSAAAQPTIRLDAEYIQSLTVRNTALIEMLQESEGEADTQLTLNVNAHAAGTDLYRVILQVRLQVGAGKKANFSIDLDYEGCFCVTEVNESILPIILFVQCPHLLFPAVRHIITTLTQNSGLPPFNMQPINFMDMFQEKIKEQNASIKGQ